MVNYLEGAASTHVAGFCTGITMRYHILIFAAALVLVPFVSAQQPAQIYTQPPVPPREVLERLNLRMAWRVYLPTIGKRDSIHSVLILENQIVALTRYGVTISLDPETGAVQWRVMVGEPYGVTRPLEADARFIYVDNLGKRYAIGRTSGEPAPGGPTPIRLLGALTEGEGLQSFHQDVVYTVRLDRSLTAQAVEGGYLLWRFSLPGRVFRWPDVTNADVFIAPEGAGLYRLDRVTGQSMWNNLEATRFLAANPKFVYATDRTGRLLVLDYARGTRLSALDTHDFVFPISNEMTDRVFLAARNGLIVCLHDRDYPTPLRNKDGDAPKKIFKNKPQVGDPVEEKTPPKDADKGGEKP